MTSGSSMQRRHRWPIMQILLLLVQTIGLNSLVSGAGVAATPTPTPTTPIATSTAVHLSPNTTVTRIAFGSCNKVDRPQPMWQHLLSREPDLWIWLGDVVYADRLFLEAPSPDMSRMKEMYRAQYTKPEYAAFRQQTPVIGIYDDHDYGENDGDSAFANKEAARHIFLDFVDESVTSPRRYRDGIYQDYVFGPKGERIKIILLDARYNQDPVADDMLGSNQWSWLESAIDSDPDIDLFLLGTGVQLVSVDKRIGEGWRLKPKSRARVMDLFARRKRNRDSPVVFLSGDIHFAEADVTYLCTQDEVTPESDASKGAQVTVTPFYEFTSSGLTHSVTSQFTPQLAAIGLPLILAERHSYAEQLDPAQSIRGVFSDMNFGMIEIDWEEKRIQVEIIDKENQPRLHYSLPFSTLSSMTFKNDLSIPAYLSHRCEAERIRESSPAMWVIPGVKFAVGLFLLIQFTLAVIVAAIWHWISLRNKLEEKKRQARESFKFTLKEKQEKKAELKKSAKDKKSE